MRSIKKGMMASSSQDEDIIDLGAVLSTIWRGKFIIALIVCLTLLIGGTYAYVLATRMYEATAVVMLNNRTETVVDRGSVVGALGSSSTIVRTEVEVLQSRELLGKVVDDLDLTEDPEFNAALRPPSLSRLIKTWVRSVAFGQSRAAEVELSVEDAAALEQQQRESTISALLQAVTILNVPQSLVFEVTVRTGEPQKTAAIADTLVDRYILNQLEVKFDATRQATSWLTDRVAGLQLELEEAESRVTEFRASTPLISQEVLQGLEVQVKDMRDRINGSQASLRASKDRLAALRAAETPQEQVAVTDDLRLQRLLPNIDDPGVAESFETRVTQLETRLEGDVSRNESQLVSLTSSLRTLESQNAQQSQDLITLQQLTREAEASRLLYEYFLGRLKETSAQQGVQQADSRVISPAVIPTWAASPRKPIILVLSVILGLVLGVVTVLLREARNRSFRSAEQLETATGYAAIGQLPLIKSKRRKDAITYLKDRPSSAAAEAIRNLRTSVMLSNVDTPPKVIMVSSSLPGEGKTTVALSLALNFASMGKKVLLIEGDIRRRVFGQYLETAQNEGVVSVLSGTRTFEEVVIHDPLLEADVLLGDKGQTNAADIFSSERFSSLMKELRSQYDVIVVDTPPVLIVPDARVIAQHVDATIFVVKWDQTQQQQVLGALKEFESVGAPVSGLVLNQINPRGMKRYGYGNSYGPYSAYGSKYYLN